MQKHFKQQSRLWDYTINKKLGKGTSGQVFQVMNKNTHKIYALKKMSIAGTQEKQKVQAFKEIKCLSLLTHSSIIQYKESFLSMDNIYIVMEYAAKGDFMKIVEQRKRRQRFYTEEELWGLFEQIIKGVKYLHEKSIIHRDLKLQNIFMTENGKVKIGDLGMAKILTNDEQLISTRVGTPVYFAPQVIQNQLYSFPVDIWSLGCVLYYLTTLQHPFQEASIQTLAYYVIEKGPKPIKGQYSIQLINFISSCLEKDAKKRPNIFQLAIRVKNQNQKQNQRPNKVSIFNLKHLHKILTVSIDPKNDCKSQRKIKSKKQYCYSICSPRKIYTSLDDRKKIASHRNIVQSRNTRSSAENQNFLHQNQLIDSPQSPTLKKRFSKHDKEQTYRAKKLIVEQFQDLIHSPLIKTNGFSIHMVNSNKQQNKLTQQSLFQVPHEQPLLLRRAFSRRSHR